MKKIIKIISAAVVLIWVTACYDALENKGMEDDTVKNGITKKEAAEVFQQKIRNYETLKGKGNLPANPLLPSDYTPQWSDAVYSENEYIWSIEAPIISSKQLKTSHTDEKQPWSAVISQKVVVIKLKETKETEMFVLSLIPDRKCFKKYRHHRGRIYTHVGDTRRFSGTAVYTLWEGTNVLINEHTETEITQRFKYNREKSFYVQKDFSNAVIGESGNLVLMDYYGGELEGSIVIGKGNSGDKMPEYCPVCHYSVITCHCGINGGDGNGGGNGGGDYFPPGYPDPGGGGEGGNTNPQPTKYTVTISVAGNGTVKGNGTSASNINGTGVYEYNKGTYISITALANTGYKFTGWQGDVSGTSSSIWIENLNKNMSVTANFTSKAEPYTARPDDKFFKTVFDTIMEKQMPNSCATTVMVYVSKLLCNKIIDENKYIKRYNRKYKKWVIIDGVDNDKLSSFLSQYFVLGSFTSYSTAIDAGKVVFATVPASDGGHAVLVVGYGADGSLLYMDPEEGSLMRSDSDFPLTSSRFVINKCD